MCGICGEIRFDNSTVEENRMDLMMDAITPRGPDNKGFLMGKSFFLGHSRLSIIDTSSKSNQPMTDKDLSLSVIFNGVIYNYLDLKKRLQNKGYTFDTDGDTEVILKAYHHYGEECVKYFDGIFAFCIHDKLNKIFFLSRDRFGIKPLYYRINKDYFMFSSTMIPLIDNDEKINNDALNYHFFLHSSVPAPDTIFSSIKKLPPGNNLIVTESGKVSQKQYYSIIDIPIKYEDNEKEILDNIESLLLESIKKRLCVSDVPVGVLLSGGLDSSLITAMASKHKLAEVETFSIGFDSISKEVGDEFFYSDLVSNEFSSKHEKIVINKKDLLYSLDSVISNMPEPMSGQDAAAFFLLGKEVSKKRKVVLSGQGADELFAGYPWYSLMSKNNSSDEISKFSKFYLDRSIEDYKRTINKPFCSEHATDNFIRLSFGKYNKNLSFLDKLLRFDIAYLIVDDPVKRVDSMTMAWGLETRVPFLDRDLIEYLSSIPSERKIMSSGKYYLKKIAERYLQSEIIYRRKFHFPVPPLKIIKDEILSYSKSILRSEACNKRGIFNNKNIEHLLNKPNEEFTKLEGNKLWHLTVFERWFQLNVDKKNPL